MTMQTAPQQASGSSTFQFLAGFATGFVMVGTGWLAVIPEVFIRWNFGERYLTVQRVVSAAIWLVIINAGLNIFNILPNMVFNLFGMGAKSDSIFAVLFTWPVVLFLLVAGFHLGFIQWRKYFGAPVHSMSNGESHFVWVGRLLVKIEQPQAQWLARKVFLNDWVLYLIVEPAFWFLIGFFVSQIHPFFGGWVIGAAAGLTLRNHSYHNIKNRRQMDLMDSHIEATQYSKAMSGAPKSETAGFTVVPVSKRQQVFLGSTDFDATVRETMRRGGPFQASTGADGGDPPPPIPTN
jgi:hypothetical protein